MATIPETSTTLLRDLASDSQHARWGEFVARYRPMMEAFMRERFPALDADDMIQETLIALIGIFPNYRYSPDENGHFRNYLTGILRNKAMNALRKEQRQRNIVEDVQCAGRATANSDEESWRESVFNLALRRFLADEAIADRTKRILERTAINGESPESVAAAFKMSHHAVDQAKSRAIARLRELVKELEDAANG